MQPFIKHTTCGIHTLIVCHQTMSSYSQHRHCFTPAGSSLDPSDDTTREMNAEDR